jgi:transcriptional regulator with XRE-family HTH domain
MAADLHPVYNSEVERGTKAVSMETLWRISKTLRVPLSQLVRAM